MICCKVEDQNLILQSWSEDDLSILRDFKVVYFLKTLFIHIQNNSIDTNTQNKEVT